MPIFIKIKGVQGDVQTVGYDDGEWFEAGDFSFGIERELLESGEKGGTEDINIGVGELQECTISKSMDRATTALAQLAINGNSPGTAQIDFVQLGDKAPAVYLRYKLDRCFIKSWSTGGAADGPPVEAVELYYNKIAFTVAGTKRVFSWDRTKQIKWTGSGLTALPPIGPPDA